MCMCVPKYRSNKNDSMNLFGMLRFTRTHTRQSMVLVVRSLFRLQEMRADNSLSFTVSHKHMDSFFSLPCFAYMYCTPHEPSLALRNQLNADMHRLRSFRLVWSHAKPNRFVAVPVMSMSFWVYELPYRVRVLVVCVTLIYAIVQHCTTAMNVSRSVFIVSMCMIFFPHKNSWIHIVVIFSVYTYAYTAHKNEGKGRRRQEKKARRQPHDKQQ